MSRSTRLIAGFFVTMAVIVGSACGASTPATLKAGSTTIAERSNDVPGGDASTTTAATDEKPSTSKPSTKLSKGGSFCDMAKGYEDVVSNNLFDFEDPSAMPDPDEIMNNLVDGMDEVFGYMKDMAKQAPAEIRADLTLMLDSADDYMDVLRSAKSLDDPELEKASELMETPKLQAAADRLEAYMKDVCGVDLEESFMGSGS